MIGSTVDQYKILNILGENPTSETYLAEHAQSGARFALQAIRPEMLAKPGFKQSLLTDVVQLIKLDHPNIVSPTNVLEVEGRLYIVSEFVEGQSLKAMLSEQGGKLGIDGLLRVFKDILRGFGYAHTEGMTLGLLSLNSIVVTPDGEAKILGFGTVLPREREKRMSESDKLIYANYFSPERFSNPETTDIRANIYGLGAMLFQLVTGQTPFSGSSIFELEMAHGQNPVTDPKRLRDDLPGGLSETITRALSKKPEDRFQTTLEFYKEVEKIENMRRSELFQTDFTKGFGDIKGLEQDNVVDASDSSVSFHLDDPFSSSEPSDGFDLPSDADSDDLMNKETVRDSNFNMDLLEAESQRPEMTEDWEQAFDSSMSDIDPGSGADFDFQALPDDGFDIGSGMDEPESGGPPPAEPVDAGPPPAGPAPGEDPFAPPSGEDPFAPPSGEDSSDFGFDFGDSFDSSVDLGQPAPSDPTRHPGADSTAGDEDHSDAFFATEDGAFSFEPSDEPDAPQAEEVDTGVDDMAPPMPEVRRTRQGMQDSMEALDEDFSRPIATVKVKKHDKRVVFITAVMAVVLVVFGVMWFMRYRAAARMDDQISQIQQLKIQRQFSPALLQIESLLAQDPPSKYQRSLSNIKRQIEEEQAEADKQIETLMARAQNYEATGKTFVDGKMDAFGTYLHIMDLDPENLEARAAAHDIKAVQLGRIRELEQQGKEVEALRVLGALVSADTGDSELKQRYDKLKSRLVTEKSGTLKAEINQLMGDQAYDEIPSKFLELTEIESKSEFIKETKPLLLDTYSQLGESARAKKNYVEAAKYYEYIVQLDPKNDKAIKQLAEVQEDSTLARIEKTQLLLDRATEKGDLALQYRYANDLNELDPGNSYANSALVSANEKLGRLMDEADSQRDLGQFKKAARLYKRIYEIRGDENARIMWKKYERWAPPTGMAFVPGGRFKMGYNPDISARPTHYVTLSPFFVDAKEVTNAEFKAFVDANPGWSPSRIDAQNHDGNYLRHWENGAPVPGTENQPVSFVSWYAAKAYAQYHGKRLLTEAEWEMAARGGTTGQKYWWGNYSDAKKAIYEFYPPKRPGDTGSFPANAYGIYEILGNVSEWVEDTYSPEFYASTRDANDPVNTDEGEKVHRGGNFKSRGRDMTVFKRQRAAARTCDYTIGFRCAKAASVK